jgi:hypothetical protein
MTKPIADDMMFFARTQSAYPEGGGTDMAMTDISTRQMGANGDDVMKELIERIAKSLVDYPEHVTVNEIVGKQTTILELKVAKEDIGKVIGKKGQTANALRTLLSAASGKVNKHYILEIIG